ncbi:MAG: four helix bundle protein [Patescibacteria group bacterium]
MKDFPKQSRYTLGGKIDQLFVDVAELLYLASYLNKEQKIPYLQKAIPKLDLLKFFLQVAWELQELENKRYLALSEPLNEIGRMLGGWLKKTETPAR